MPSLTDILKLILVCLFEDRRGVVSCALTTKQVVKGLNPARVYLCGEHEHLHVNLPS